MPEFTVSSTLPASRAAVWARVSTMAGVNDELGPWFRMTHPPGLDRLEGVEVPLGERLFRSRVLLFGVLPVDYDDLVLVRLEPGRGFLERSRMLSQRVWEHERTLSDDGAGCVVTDRVRFEPRVPVLAGAQRALLRAIFRHRHRRLRRFFGAPRSYAIG